MKERQLRTGLAIYLVIYLQESKYNNADSYIEFFICRGGLQQSTLFCLGISGINFINTIRTKKKTQESFSKRYKNEFRSPCLCGKGKSRKRTRHKESNKRTNSPKEKIQPTDIKLTAL